MRAAGAALVLAAGLLGGCAQEPGTEADASLGAPGRAAQPAASHGGAAGDGLPRLSAERACTNAGYLCRDLTEEGLRIVRWPEDLPVLTIRLHPPTTRDPDLNDRLRRAAVQGLLAWHGVPFPLRILDREGVDDEGADIHVRWRSELEGGELGRVRSEWRSDGAAGIAFEVADFVLAMGLGVPHQRPLTAEEVRLTAAHEMGHALGLGHSDSPRDLMYPSNTAGDVSVRDYRTLEALYALPNGALIVP